MSRLIPQLRITPCLSAGWELWHRKRDGGSQQPARSAPHASSVWLLRRTLPPTFMILVSGFGFFYGIHLYVNFCSVQQAIVTNETWGYWT